MGRSRTRQRTPATAEQRSRRARPRNVCSRTRTDVSAQLRRGPWSRPKKKKKKKKRAEEKVCRQGQSPGQQNWLRVDAPEQGAGQTANIVETCMNARVVVKPCRGGRHVYTALARRHQASHPWRGRGVRASSPGRPRQAVPAPSDRLPRAGSRGKDRGCVILRTSRLRFWTRGCGLEEKAPPFPFACWR